MAWRFRDFWQGIEDNQSIYNFRQDAISVSTKFSKIEKRKRSLENLKKATYGKISSKGGQWLPCCRPGVPCPSRIITTVTSDSHNCKNLLVACAEVKYCLLSTG